MKFMNKGRLLEESFTAEREQLRLQYELLAERCERQQGVITRFSDMILRQEAQNLQLRTELLMFDHPRWQLIPTIEFISVIDFHNLTSLIKQRLEIPLYDLSNNTPDDVLAELYEKKQANFRHPARFTNPNKNYLYLLLKPLLSKQ